VEYALISYTIYPRDGGEKHVEYAARAPSKAELIIGVREKIRTDNVGSKCVLISYVPFTVVDFEIYGRWSASRRAARASNRSTAEIDEGEEI